MRQGTAGVLLFALAIGTTLLSAPGAEARVARDLCPQYGTFPLSASTSLVCGPIESVEASSPAVLGNGLPEPECPPGTKLLGADGPFGSRFTASWDFWAEDGEWVTWTASGTFFQRDGQIVLFKPLVYNWWAGGRRRVRLFQVCGQVQRSRQQAAAEAGTVEVGGSGADDFDGSDANDVQAGAGGADELTGGAGDDEQYAGAGNDESRGGDGADQLLSGGGDDVSSGGRGSDELFDNEGDDDLRGGPGGDRFSAHDGDRDRIDCGDGEDVVVADGRDRIAPDCEHVYTSRKDAPKRPPA